MKRRVLVLPFAALVIAGLCLYKLSQSGEPVDPNRPMVAKQQAPLFELHDQRKPPQVMQLKSFLGRHWIVMVFFDEQSQLDEDPIFVWLRQHANKLRSENVKVLAISNALPQTHRKMLKDWLSDDEEAPFLMLSDLDGKVHKQYGLSASPAQKLSTSVFLIDRAGNMPWDVKPSGRYPLPMQNPRELLAREFAIED